ncbi:hypothetical protein DU508_22405 [Pedobacter chinensis]|uniref:Uncharacterized protein n=1 Tax=Pedobacter chinensis TaxID=2282421 RepID=A0A369PPN8_9SPHI|nr:polysaccharide biosynthesis C-terminal domain-containing protein [Pedobacter chinensis]RDC54242.1 hypothetical protein DU508_22405 [Pedobacter chinensis]
MSEQHKNFFFVNYLLYLLTQFLNLVTPFIILPILSRRLGVEGVGNVSYVLAISQVFITISAAGMINYGNRKLSASKNIEQDFRLLFSIQLFTSTLAVVFFLAYTFFIEKKLTDLFLISCLGVLANIFDFSWYFIAANKIKNITFRNIIVKVIMAVGTFFFVNDVQDIDIYLYLYFGATFLLNLLMVSSLPKSYLFIFKLKLREFFEELRKVSLFFVPTLLMLMYASFDKIFLAKSISNSSLAIYDNALKIITILCVITASLSPLMVSKLASSEEKQITRLVEGSVSFVCYVAFPILFGIIAIAGNLVDVLFGHEFIEMTRVLIILSPIIFFIGIGDVLVNQIIISMHMDKKYTLVMLVMVILSVILNIILIPRFNHDGAAYGNMLSHFLILFLEFYICAKYLSVANVIRLSLIPLTAAVLMFFSVTFLDISSLAWVNLLVKITVGFASYILAGFLLGSKFQKDFIIYLLNKIKKA